MKYKNRLLAAASIFALSLSPYGMAKAKAYWLVPEDQPGASEPTGSADLQFRQDPLIELVLLEHKGFDAESVETALRSIHRQIGREEAARIPDLANGIRALGFAPEVERAAMSTLVSLVRDAADVIGHEFAETVISHMMTYMQLAQAPDLVIDCGDPSLDPRLQNQYCPPEETGVITVPGGVYGL